MAIQKAHQNGGELLLIADAARLAGRSESWIRGHRSFGPLEPVYLDGKQAVRVRDLIQLVQRTRARDARWRTARLERERRQRRHLRLVVSNP